MLSRASDRSPVAAAVFGSLLVTVAGIGVWLGSRTQYYPFTNDFWPLLFQASTFDWAKPESFKNGFFPPVMVCSWLSSAERTFWPKPITST